MYPRDSTFSRPVARFPRTRGDVPATFNLLSACRMLPPHMRGCTHSHLLELASPAHAGMYPRHSTCSPPVACFPRTCGDVPTVIYWNWLPPHTRRGGPIRVRRRPRQPAFPAHAEGGDRLIGTRRACSSFPAHAEGGSAMASRQRPSTAGKDRAAAVVGPPRRGGDRDRAAFALRRKPRPIGMRAETPRFRRRRLRHASGLASGERRTGAQSSTSACMRPAGRRRAGAPPDGRREARP